MSTSDSPSKWAYPDPERLWKVAHKIEEKQLWAGYLSEQEHIIWRKALRSKDAWNVFLSGHGEGLDPEESQDSVDIANGTNKSGGNSDKPPDPVSTAFRARSMLFDSSIRKLFPSQSGDDLMNFDFEDIEAEERNMVNGVVEHKPKTREIEEDDYDEDEDEASSTTVQQTSIVQATDTSMDNLDEAPQLPEIKSFPFDTYYHTLEHDRVAMLELQTVEELNRQNNQEATGNGTQSSLQHVNFGAANLSLKHLLSKIDASRDKLNLTEAELRKLFSDVRKNRSNSKWASDDLIGREELYEALESMLKKIMADRNALPFMAKVRRQQAPDYYNIIKKPMDLGTIQRALRGGTHFKSKAQFMEELDLIWENCLQYNTDPNHYLRGMAISMRNLSNSLAELVPDITIKTRAEVEAEEAAADAEDEAHSEDEKPVKSGRKAGGYSSKGVSQKGGPSMMRGPTHEEGFENKLLNGVREGSIAGSQDGRSSSHVNGLYATPPPGGTPLGDMEGQLDPAQVVEQARADGENEDDEGDILSREWASQTQQARAQYALQRHKLLQKGLTEEEIALIRTRKAMSKFKEWDDRAYDVIRFKEPEPEPDPEAEEPLEEEDNEEEQFLAEYEVAAGILANSAPAEDDEAVKDLYSRQTDRIDIPILDPRLQPPREGLLEIMRENAKKLGEIRKICNKIAIIRNMGQQPPGVYQTPAPSTSKIELDELAWAEDEEDEQKPVLPGPLLVTPDLGQYAMEQTVARVLFHTGFEDFQISAFDLITGIAIEYLQKIGATLSLYMSCNDHKTQYTEEEMLLHTLDMNGVEDLEKLNVYIKDDIERYGTKLEDCHRRLKRFYAELLRPAFQEGEDGTNIFNDQNESFLSGDFTDDLGEDFFGFRELGLDKEFGLISMAVPLRLLQGRMRAVINPVGGEGGAEAASKELTEPPPWEPVTTESIEFEIGLVQPFLREKVNLSDQSYIVEDENLPMKQRPAKPRLPPTGKIITPRKRKDMPTLGGSAKKKKKPTKEKPPEAPTQLPTPPMASIREEEGSDVESLFG